jgi:hypothetical protein
MATKLRTILIMTARLSWLVALGLGVAWWAGATIPLHGHMTAGGLLALCLAGLGGLALRRSLVAAGSGAILLALVVPAAGMAQLQAVDYRLLVQVLHLAAALAAMGWAEWLAKRLRARPAA